MKGEQKMNQQEIRRGDTTTVHAAIKKGCRQVHDLFSMPKWPLNTEQFVLDSLKVRSLMKPQVNS
jgi:hypothetical protein